mmetsp:Transcript_27698/g.56646  ORF Transcript_27698/g.56646 Transcript_27698/m.56646 type:complete len:367 (+) Transcript_27698:48-1148(+)
MKIGVASTSFVLALHIHGVDAFNAHTSGARGNSELFSSGGNGGDTPIFSRREWISAITVAGSIAPVIMLGSQAAKAAPPLTAEVADNFSARAERALRLKPRKVLRPKMNLDFAVLLMRSSYNAVDELDIVPMDHFQRDFFLIRQAEYQPYADSLGPGTMTQGDLADPNYFDFISFAQYATISREIVNPPAVFEEQQPVEVEDGEPQQFVKVVVRRDPFLTNNVLSQKHSELVGNSILDKLNEKFGDTASSIPKIEPGSRPDAAKVLEAIKQVTNLFLVSGFALEGSAAILKEGQSEKDAAGTQFCISLTSPATLWSGQALKSKKPSVANDFMLKTIRALLSRAGYTVVDSSVNYVNNQEISSFSII